MCHPNFIYQRLLDSTYANMCSRSCLLCDVSLPPPKNKAREVKGQLDDRVYFT